MMYSSSVLNKMIPHLTTQEMLGLIATYLNVAPNKSAKEVFAVLSALRGPDCEKPNKRETTAVIRSTMGIGSSDPDILNNFASIGCEINPQKWVTIPIKILADVSGDHFYDHIKWAARILGLEIRHIDEEDK